MSRTLKHRLGLVAESSYGVTPGTPTILGLECSSASPTLSVPKTQSATVRNDGNIASSVTLNRSASYSRSQELVYPTTSEGLFSEIRAVMREDAAVTAATPSDTLAVTGGASSVTRSAGSFVTDGFQPGDIVKVTNVATAADNGYRRVLTVAALTMGLKLPGAGTWAGNDTDMDLVPGTRLVNGITDYSYTLEECWLDTQKMVTWTGMRPASMSIGFAMGQKSTIGISYVGKDGEPGTMASASVGITGSTYTEYTDSLIFSPKDAIIVEIEGTVIPCASFNVTLSNGARVRHSTSGGAAPDAAPTGATRVQLSLTAYASVLTQLSQHRDGTEMGMMVIMDAPDGKAIGMTFGTVVWDTASIPMSGLDQDVMVTVSGVATLTPAADANDQDWTMRLFLFS